MTQTLTHDYYYGGEAEQYIFYRLPKALFTNDRYKNLSDSAKILYGLMLDRMGLSIKNGWLDEQDRVYIYFTLDDVQEYMRCGHNKGVKLMAELDDIGLIERVKQGQGKPTRIYVKKFYSDGCNPCNIKENMSYPQDYPQGNPDFRKEEVKTSDNGKSRVPQKGSADFPKEDTNNNYINNTDLNDNYMNHTHPIPSYQRQEEQNSNSSDKAKNYDYDTEDEMDRIDIYREIIKENVEYDIICEKFGKTRIDELVELMLETVCSTQKSIRIAGSDIPIEAVKSRMLKVDSSHIEYVISCLKENTTKVRNIKAYLLTMIYNAPVTMDSYYRTKVNHDLSIRR